MVRAACGNFPLLHCLQHRRLRFGRRPVDFIGQHNIREDGAFQKFELSLVSRLVLMNHLRAGYIARHQVRCKLNALELEIERFRQRRHQQRLRQTRHTHQQRMAAGEYADQHLVNHVVLADDDLGEFRANLGPRPGELLYGLKVLPLQLRLFFRISCGRHKFIQYDYSAWVQYVTRH